MMRECQHAGRFRVHMWRIGNDDSLRPPQNIHLNPSTKRCGLGVW